MERPDRYPPCWLRGKKGVEYSFRSSSGLSPVRYRRRSGNRILVYPLQGDIQAAPVFHGREGIVDDISRKSAAACPGRLKGGTPPDLHQNLDASILRLFPHKTQDLPEPAPPDGWSGCSPPSDGESQQKAGRRTTFHGGNDGIHQGDQPRLRLKFFLTKMSLINPAFSLMMARGLLIS